MVDGNVEVKQKRIILLTLRERENKIKRLNKKLREVNQKLKNNKNKKRKTDLFKQQEILKEELNECRNVLANTTTTTIKNKGAKQKQKNNQRGPM